MSSPSSPSQGYILTNTVSHTRFFPLRHSFRYTTLSVFVELSALEEGKLDVPLLFGYNKRWQALCALRSNGYLFSNFTDTEMGLKGKLEVLLRREGYAEIVDDGQYKAWMLTTPTYLGFEGINPLTVYLLIKSRELTLVVLEVHNTFGESHVYFMRPGVNEDSLSSLKESLYNHQWTFPRAFHVSPFNDRKGFYTIAIRLPSMLNAEPLGNTPKLAISIQLREPDSNKPGKTKLTATLRTTSALPLAPSSFSAAKNILFAVASFPLTLFLTMPRILHQAWILHYVKGRGDGGQGGYDEAGLEIYIRPEPFLPLPPLPSHNIRPNGKTQIYPDHGAGSTVRRLGAGFLTSCARERVREFLRSRVQSENEGKLSVVLVEPDAFGGQDEWFHSDSISAERRTKADGMSEKILRITPLTPLFFELLLTAPSPGLALLAGGVVDPLCFDQDSKSTLYANILSKNRGPNDVLFMINDAKLFLRVFGPSFSSESSLIAKSAFLTQRLRLSALRPSLVALANSKDKEEQDSASEADIWKHLLYIPEIHPFDSFPTASFFTVRQIFSSLGLIGLLVSCLALSALEPRIFALFHVRTKNRTETWSSKLWERVEGRLRSAREQKM